MSRPRLAIALLVMLVLTACTGELPRPSASAPALPADVFPALPDRGAGVETTVEAMVSDGETMLMVLTVEGRISVPVLRYSTDAGATWRDGEISASGMVIGEEAVGVAAVAGRSAEHGWLTMTEKDQALFAWTSTDAQTWARTPVIGIDPAQGDGVTSVAGLASGGFVAVGGRWHDDSIRPTAWTSADGITWAAHPIAGRGRLNEVATRGDQVVAVGHRDFAEVTRGRSQLPLLFTSTDRGVRWRRVGVKEPATSGDYAASLDHVTATGRGFVAGGSYYDDATEGYRPLLLTSDDLRSWRPTRRMPDAGRSSNIDELLRVGSATTAVQRVRRTGKGDELRVWYLFDGDANWTAGSVPKAKQSAWTMAAAGAGETAVFAVGIDTRPRSTRLWRLDSPARLGEIDVAPSEARAQVELDGLLVADGALTAYGRAQGEYVLWRAGGVGFGDPTPLGVAATESVDRVAWSADGGYLATGQVDGRDAFARQSGDGTAWRRTSPTVFNRIAPYHSSTISAAAWVRGRWVVVGDRTSNGDARLSALVATSPDGIQWRPGRPAKVTARGDWYGRRDPLDDLNGLDGRSREMVDVTAAGRGLVAVGSIGGDGTRPAAWTARDSQRWRLVPLTSAGYAHAEATTIHRVDGVLLGSGWALKTNSTRPVRATWRSTDDGEHWTFSALEGTHALTLFTAGEREFLHVVLADDHRTVTLWRSPDGVTWTQSPVVVDGLGDGMEVSLEDALVHDGALQLLLTLQDRRDAVSVVQRVSL